MPTAGRRNSRGASIRRWPAWSLTGRRAAGCLLGCHGRRFSSRSLAGTRVRLSGKERTRENTNHRTSGSGRALSVGVASSGQSSITVTWPVRITTHGKYGSRVSDTCAFDQRKKKKIKEKEKKRETRKGKERKGKGNKKKKEKKRNAEARR